MDVQKILSAVACVLVLSSCSNKKSISSVFPDNGSLDSRACMGQSIEGKYIVQWEDGSFTTEYGRDSESFAREFVEPRLEDIRFVEKDRELKIETPTLANHPSAADSWGIDRIGARDLWNQGFYGQGIKVGVVDAFVDVTHPQLHHRIAINTGEIPNNGIDDDSNGVVDDYYGASFVSIPSNNPNVSPHGTHVAGIIAADPQFGQVEGTAPQAMIIPGQFIANDGGGSLGDAILAMQYVAQRGAKVINASWGGAPCVASLRNTFLDLQNKGILLVVAAGNDARNIDVYPEFPASFNFSSQITVAASSLYDFMTSWTNSGFNLVHVAALGDRILSAGVSRHSA